jgi:MFS family permease
LIGDHIAYEGIFFLLAGMCVVSIFATLMIHRDELDDDLARGGDEALPAAETPRVVALGMLFRDRRILVFSASIVLFHFANAAMLPLVGQKMTSGKTEGVAGYMSYCIIAAQLVMVPVAIVSSRLADSWGRRGTFLIGFAVLPVRGVLYTLTDNPYALVAVQLLDGIGAGIFGVVGILVIADLTRGTGRFNVMQGALATATGIGASASNLMTGAIVSRFGFNIGFWALSAIAAVALVFFSMAMPETRPEAGSGPDLDRKAVEPALPQLSHARP